MLVGVLIAWISGAGSWLVDRLFPGPLITAEAYYSSCETYVVPGEIDRSDPAPPVGEQAEWALARGGAHAVTYADAPQRGTSEIVVTVAGYEERPVTITGLRFIVAERRDEPLNGTVVVDPCGGAGSFRFVEANLDETPPTVTDSSAFDFGERPEDVTPLKFPYLVKKDETETLKLSVYTEGYVEWTATLSWSDGSTSGILRIDDEGRPFRVSAQPPSAPHILSVNESWEECADWGC